MTDTPSAVARCDRRPLVWVAFAAFSLVCALVAWRLFPQAMPIVNLGISMTRDAAIAQATALADAQHLVPPGARQAAVFNQDSQAQSYVELEGGGKPAFAALVSGTLYAPYWWEVRLFHPGVVEEASIAFRPDGSFNGFSRRVADTYVRDAKTMALAPEAALALAKERAARDFHVDLTPYTLLDQAQQTRPSGRVDHRFTFERAERFGEARLRLELAVTGDELTAIDPVFHLPESFGRRYREMRSTNDTIAQIATIVAGVVYGLFGCIVGALWLLRRGALAVRPALVAGFAVSGLGALAVLAQIPIAWFGFNTALDTSNFWVQQLGMAALTLVAGGFALGLVFMAAEGLTRRAFGEHPQLWRVWAADAAGTRAIGGRTLAGYLLVPIELAFVATFYYATNRWLGWWQPSEQLTDPNILASYFPAIGPIALALQAGMMEECLFRAIPLALGALVGARFGHRRAGIAVAFVLQAVVFGAAHANYPGFPAYSRLVELVVPSLVWAAIFLRYGLVPTMLLHALFDLTLMSIPVFLMEAPFAGVQRGVVIAAGLVPLAVVLVRRLRLPAWGELPAALRNAGWQRAAAAVARRPVAAPAARDEARPAAALLQRALPLLGVAGLAAWILATPLRADAPPLALSRGEAITVAEAALAVRGVTLGPEWRRLAVPRSAVDDAVQGRWHRFVWREAGPAAYRELVGTTLAPPLWDVRFARFEGGVADRAEEWRVAVQDGGTIRQVVHRLPEERPGARLERAAAQAIVERTLAQQFGAAAAGFVARGADQIERPQRRDWVFAYADPRVDVGKGGEARVQVALAGDEVASAGRSLYLPQAWLRAEEEKEGTRQWARLAAGALGAALAVAVLVFAGVSWSRRRYDARVFRGMAGLAFAAVLVSAANSLPARAFALSTAEPLANQAVTALLGVAAAGLVVALLLGLAAAVGVHDARTTPRLPLAGRAPPWVAGALAALATAGIGAVLARLAAPALPVWPDVAYAAPAWPWLAAVLAAFASVPASALTLFFLALVARATSGWTRRLVLVCAALALASALPGVVAGGDLAQALAKGAIEGISTFAFGWLVLRYDLRTVPAFVATGIALAAVHDAALAPVATHLALVALELIVLVAVTVWTTRYVGRLAPG